MTDAGAEGLPQAAAPGDEPGVPAAQALFNPFGTLGIVVPAPEELPQAQDAGGNAAPSMLAFLVAAVAVRMLLTRAAE